MPGRGPLLLPSRSTLSNASNYESVLSSQPKQQGLGFTLAGWKASQEIAVLWEASDALRICTWLLDRILGSLSQLLSLPRSSVLHR